WTIKDILLHLIDTERVFSYRALRIARGDSTPLPGFDQDLYVENALARNRTMTSLIEEYKSLRQSTLTLFKTFTPEMLISTGTASDSAISVRAIGYILSGHENHHKIIIEDRYL
ncbi:MAG: DinB family protein, partial [Winogradskyella sp.]|nr:DinB family protein [Winogradskyella sp.]